MKYHYSVVIPSYNEEHAISSVIKELQRLPHAKELEIIVVNDGSDDATAEVARTQKVTVLSNVQNFGYGYSLKRGITEASHNHIIILDADGSYPVTELPRLINEYERGFDMVVGARQGTYYRGSTIKRFARLCFKLLSEFATGRRIPDINSGCRIFARTTSIRFFHTLSSGFSFTTTITLAYMLNAYSVSYLSISYHKRKGASKVKYWRDTLRSTQIIIEAIMFYNPLKLFILCAVAVLLTGIVSGVIFIFSPFAALLFFGTISMSILVFALGLMAVLVRFIGSKQE
jgi:glycosyltransferase involved in cell wall biosynthesis